MQEQGEPEPLGELQEGREILELNLLRREVQSIVVCPLVRNQPHSALHNEIEAPCKQRKDSNSPSPISPIEIIRLLPPSPRSSSTNAASSSRYPSSPPGCLSISLVDVG